MASVDFPNSPTTNQVFTSGNIQFQWDGAKWASGSLTGFAPATNPAGGSANYAPIASPTFTGTVTIPAGASISGFAPLASPTFTGIPSLPTGTTAVTQTAGNSSTALATTAFVATSFAPLASPVLNGSVLDTTTSGAPDFAIGSNTTTGIVAQWNAIGTASINWSYGNYYNGTNWVATLTSAGAVNHSAGSINFLVDTGLTVGNTYTPANRFQVTPALVTSVPPILCQSTTNPFPGVVIGTNLTTGAGTSYNHTSWGFGYYYSGSNWMASSTTAFLALFGGNGGLTFYGNTGLTAGNAFTPAPIMGMTTATTTVYSTQLVAQGSIAVGATGITYAGAPNPGHFFMFGWTGSQMLGYVDNVALGAITFTSDIRFKTDIAPIERDAVAALCQLELQQFDMPSAHPNRLDHYDIGFSAQQLESVIPEAVFTPNNDEFPKSVNLIALVGYQTRAIQQLAERLDALEKK